MLLTVLLEVRNTDVLKQLEGFIMKSIYLIFILRMFHTLTLYALNHKQYCPKSYCGNNMKICIIVSPVAVVILTSLVLEGEGGAVM